MRFTWCDVRKRCLVWPFDSEAQRTVRRAAQRPAFCLLQAATGGNGRQRGQRGECSEKSSEQSTDGNATQRERKRSNATQSNGGDKRWRVATGRLPQAATSGDGPPRAEPLANRTKRRSRAKGTRPQAVTGGNRPRGETFASTNRTDTHRTDTSGDKRRRLATGRNVAIPPANPSKQNRGERSWVGPRCAEPEPSTEHSRQKHHNGGHTRRRAANCRYMANPRPVHPITTTQSKAQQSRAELSKSKGPQTSAISCDGL